MILHRFFTLMAVAAVASMAASHAEAASCSRAKSKTSDTKVTVTFVNKSGEFRAVMWIDFNGNPVPYANLNPGQSYKTDTFATHAWMFTDGPGNCVEMFVAKSGSTKFNISAPSSGAGGD